MASIIERDNGFQCRVRRRGYPPVSKAFRTRQEAEEWGADVETRMKAGTYVPEEKHPIRTVQDLLKRYLDEESSKKASGTSDPSRAAALMDELGDYGIHNLTSHILAQYKRERLKSRAPQTVTHELNLLHRAYVVAVEEWGLQLQGPIPRTRRPTLPPGRSFRIAPDTVLKIIQNTESPELGEIVAFAVETAMRRSEIAAMDWRDVDLRRMVVLIPRTKNGSPRTIPLSHAARTILRNRTRHRTGPVFTMRPDSITQAFERTVKRVGMPALHFHDLRHEAISRLFEQGLNVIEVSRISGHKTLSQLDRYTHLDVKHLGKRIRSK